MSSNGSNPGLRPGAVTWTDNTNTTFAQATASLGTAFTGPSLTSSATGTAATSAARATAGEGFEFEIVSTADTALIDVYATETASGSANTPGHSYSSSAFSQIDIYALSDPTNYGSNITQFYLRAYTGIECFFGNPCVGLTTANSFCTICGTAGSLTSRSLTLTAYPVAIPTNQPLVASFATTVDLQGIGMLGATMDPEIYLDPSAVGATLLFSDGILQPPIPGQGIAVPEPASLALFATGLAGLGLMRSRRKAA